MEANMAFVAEKEELKPGLIIFRRGDVEHRMWYCRMKMPKADRYKTVSLKTTDRSGAGTRLRSRCRRSIPHQA
jgi:integrase